MEKSNANAGRMRLPPALIMYSAIWLTSGTSECSRWRITILTASMSAEIGWLMRLEAGREDVADKVKPTRKTTKAEKKRKQHEKKQNRQRVWANMRGLLLKF